MRIAVIGCGSIGLRHLRNLQSLNFVDLVAYDTNAKTLEEIESNIGVKSVGNIKDVWDMKPDVAVINTPTQMHMEAALVAVTKGCHVFIEKPLSHTLEDVKCLTDALNETDLISMVGCNMRFHPGPSQVKKWLDGGSVGQPISARIHTGSFLPRWRPEQDYHMNYSASAEWGGAILDCIHEIDLAIWLLGEAKLLSSVKVPADSIHVQAEGLAEILLRHEGGAISSVHLNYVQRNYDRGIQIIGSEGTIQWRFDGANGETLLFGQDGEIKEQLPQPAGWSMNSMYMEEMQYFTSCIEKGEPTFNPVEIAAGTLNLALEARSQA
jgi:predicted dehydrogenase